MSWGVACGYNMGDLQSMPCGFASAPPFAYALLRVKIFIFLHETTIVEFTAWIIAYGVV